MNAAQKILITGASAGIGAALARALAARGHAVVAVAREGEKLESLARKIRSDGGNATAARLDIADLTAARRVVEAHGPFAALVNNAGVIDPIAALAEAAPAEWEMCIRVNLVAAWNLAAAALPSMLAAGRGTIVNVSSAAAALPLEGWSAYCASKAGLAMLTRAIDHEYGARDIAAYGYRPGMAATEMQDKIRRSGINPVSKIPKSEMLRPEQAAAGIVWLIENRPKNWRGGAESDIRDANFRAQAGL